MKLRNNHYAPLLFITEFIAVISLFFNDLTGLTLFFTLHIFSVYLFSSLYKINNRYILTYAFLIPFFPIIFLIKKRKEQQKHIISFESKKIFTIDIKPVKRIFGESTIHNLIEDKNAPDELRIKAFLILSELINPQTISLLKKGLSDPNDEIRLLSFSVINNLEQDIQKKIHSYEKQSDSFEKYKNLAKLYWELVYLNLADEEFKKIILSQISEYLNTALSYKIDKELVILKGRIHLYNKEYEKAYKIFSNTADKSTIPFLLEIYFYKKEYNKIKKLIENNPQLKLYEKFYHIYGLWNG